MNVHLASSMTFLSRCWKSRELQLIAFAILISVICISSITFLVDGLRLGLEDKSGALLGGDRAIISAEPISDQILQKAQELKVRTTITISFLSMLVHHNELALAEVKTAGKNFPLKGELRTAPNFLGAGEISHSIPERGCVWIENRLFPLLDLNIGDKVMIGSAFFKVTRVLISLPDRTLEGMNLAPQVLMNENDITETKILQPGSRVTYQLLIAGENKDLKQFEKWVETRLSPTQSLINPKQSRPILNIALDRTDHYLSLIFMVNLCLAGIAIAIVAQKFSQKQFDTVAILRCFGASHAWILKRYLLGLSLLGLMVGLIAIIVGYVAKYFLSEWLLNKIFSQTNNAEILLPMAMGMGAVAILLLGFALPPLLNLKKITPLCVLRRDFTSFNVKNRSVSIFALLLIIVLMMLQTQDINLTVNLVLMCLGIGVLIGAIIYIALKCIVKLSQYFTIASHHIRNLTRHASENIIQVLAFSLILMFMALLFLVRNDLLKTWQNQIPAEAPNYFVVNIPPSLLNEFRGFLKENSINIADLYPMMAGRLLSVNEEPVKMQTDPNDPHERILTRLLNLTWADKLQIDNRIIEGHWFNDLDKAKPIISVEKGFAERLMIKLGDNLEFQIGDKRINAKVTSIRTVEWDSFQPNFYVIFPPGLLESLPMTYMTSFYLPLTKIPLLKKLVQQFPMVNIIDTQMVVSELKSFFDLASNAIQYLWIFTLLMSFTFLFATIIATLDERRQEAVLLRILGASRQQLLTILLSEFALLGLLAGIIGGVGATGIVYWLAQHIFDLPYTVNYQVLLLTPIIGMLLIGVGGWLGTRKVLLIPPLQLLR